MKKQAYKKYIKLFALLSFFALVNLLPTPVKAAAIQNLSCSPQTIEIEFANGRRSIILPPGRTYDVLGALKTHYRGREVRIEHDEEYAIWDDGTFGPQRYRRGSGFQNFLR